MSSLHHSSSLFCIDISTFMTFNNISFCISNSGNVFSVGCSRCNAHGHATYNLVSISQINNLTNIKMISCGKGHSICVNDNGEIFSFGINDSGQLGIGKDYKELKQTHIPQKINLPSCKQVSCGSTFTICLSEDNRVYSFGSNNFGLLGLGTDKYTYNSPQLIPGLTDVEIIECSANYTICKTFNNEIYSWGYNNFGQGSYKACNKPTQCLNWPDNIISIKSGDKHSLLLTLEGHVYSVGRNDCGQLGINDTNIKLINKPRLIEDITEIQRIECGDNHSMCIDINNNFWVFGFNFSGQLGLGDKENKHKPIQHPTLSNIIDISSGGNHTFVKTIDNKIYAFGNNKHYQLGIKTLGIDTPERLQLTPIQVFQDKEDIWCSTIGKSKQKSARK